MSDKSILIAHNNGDSTDNPLIHQLEFIVQEDHNCEENYDMDDSSVALEICKRSILKPYFQFLKLIGWRRFSSSSDIQNYHLIKKILNIIIPILFVTLILIGAGSQLILCFNRSKTFSLPVNETDLRYIRCDFNYVSNVVIPLCLVITSYFVGFYIMRYSQVEHLSNLTEKIFLGYSDKVGQFSRKKLILRLRILLSIGVAWLLLSIPLNLLRVYSQQLYSHNTYFYFLTPKNLTYLEEVYAQGKNPPSDNYAIQIAAILFALIGFFATDLSYIAAIINYSLQCQLINYLVKVTVKRICGSCHAVDQAIKEIKIIQDFLGVLNGGLAFQMSLLLFLFLGILISAIENIYAAHNHAELHGSIIGIINAISWLFLISLIIIQATRLTVACENILNLGMELRSRPFVYSDTSQLDLDSFLLYTTSIRVEARLLHIPMKSYFVLPVCFSIAYIWRINNTLF